MSDHGKLRDWVSEALDHVDECPRCRRLVLNQRERLDRTGQCARCDYWYGAPAPLKDDSAYGEWLSALATRLPPDQERAISDDELQWAERAIYEGWLVWSPSARAVRLGGRGMPPARQVKSELEYWLSGVRNALAGDPSATYGIDASERKWAREAVKRGALEWAEPDRALRLPRPPSRDPGGPYR
jgi:hypothetical protein